jgi:hypothetical protein
MGEQAGMKVAMMQPAFLPWQGFFELIYQADVFVLLDDFQFSVQSYHQRNRLFISPTQVGWYTVPAIKSGAFGQPLNHTRIDDSVPWRRKMLERLRQNYSKAPSFAEVFPPVADWLAIRSPSLAEQNQGFIQLVMELLGWKRELLISSAHPSSSERSERVLELLRWCGATRYYAARGACDYMREDAVFPVAKIEVLFQDFVPQPYAQVGSPGTFIPRLSILDALFNLGPEETARVLAQSSERWLHWDDIVGCRPSKDSGVLGPPED